MVRATSSSSSILCLMRSSSSRRAFSRIVEASMAKVCSSSRLPPARSAVTRRESMYSTPAVSSAVESTLVASPRICVMRTSGTDITLRSSRSATLSSGRNSPVPCGSKFIDSRSRRCSSARLITCRGTRKSLAGSVAPLRFRATRISNSPRLRSNRKPRSAPVTASAASTTELSTSWSDKPVCKVRATSRMARSLARLAPAPGELPMAPDFSCAPNWPINRFSSAPSIANTN